LPKVDVPKFNVPKTAAPLFKPPQTSSAPLFKPPATVTFGGKNCNQSGTNHISVKANVLSTS